MVCVLEDTSKHTTQKKNREAIPCFISVAICLICLLFLEKTHIVFCSNQTPAAIRAKPPIAHSIALINDNILSQALRLHTHGVAHAGERIGSPRHIKEWIYSHITYIRRFHTSWHPSYCTKRRDLYTATLSLSHFLVRHTRTHIYQILYYDKQTAARTIWIQLFAVRGSELR